MKLMLDCKDVSRLLSAGQDGELAAPERARMRLHLVMCLTCRNVDEQLAFIRQAMRRLGRNEPLADDPASTVALPVSPPVPPTPPREGD
jgi:predicted anti-sigma-YlaC factor YlaD